MKKLKLNNESFKLLVTNYKEWLDILGYAESTVYYLPNHLQEFFYYLEQNHIKNIIAECFIDQASSTMDISTGVFIVEISVLFLT